MNQTGTKKREVKRKSIDVRAENEESRFQTKDFNGFADTKFLATTDTTASETSQKKKSTAGENSEVK